MKARGPMWKHKMDSSFEELRSYSDNLTGIVHNVQKAVKKYEKAMGDLSKANLMLTESLEALFKTEMFLDPQLNTFLSGRRQEQDGIKASEESLAIAYEGIKAYSDRIVQAKKHVAERDSKAEEFRKQAKLLRVGETKGNPDKVEYLRDNKRKAYQAYMEVNNRLKQTLGDLYNNRFVELVPYFTTMMNGKTTMCQSMQKGAVQCSSIFELSMDIPPSWFDNKGTASSHLDDVFEEAFDLGQSSYERISPDAVSSTRRATISGSAPDIRRGGTPQATTEAQNPASFHSGPSLAATSVAPRRKFSEEPAISPPPSASAEPLRRPNLFHGTKEKSKGLRTRRKKMVSTYLPGKAAAFSKSLGKIAAYENVAPKRTTPERSGSARGKRRGGSNRGARRPRGGSGRGQRRGTRSRRDAGQAGAPSRDTPSKPLPQTPPPQTRQRSATTASYATHTNIYREGNFPSPLQFKKRAPASAQPKREARFSGTDWRPDPPKSAPARAYPESQRTAPNKPPPPPSRATQPPNYDPYHSCE